MNALLVGTSDRQIEEMLRAAGAHVTIANESSLASLLLPATAQPDVVVVDIREKNTVPSTLASIRRQHPLTGVIILSAKLEPALLLEAMHAGVNEVLAEPFSQPAVESAISRVVQQRPIADIGQVFAFIGAKGGVGTTTVAVNVGTALGAIAKPGRALVLDLHQAGGDAALFLGAEPRFSVADALDNAHRLDETFLGSLVTHVTPHLDLLAAPERAVASHVDTAKIRRVLDLACAIYKYIVIDVPRSDGPILDALDRVNTIAVVANQELATVKSAARLTATLRTRYGKDKVALVLSRSDRQADIGTGDVEKAVGGPVGFTFPSDYRLALQALNKGRPVAMDNHNDLSASFRRFASQLAGVSPVQQRETSSRSGLLGRLTGR